MSLGWTIESVPELRVFDEERGFVMEFYPQRYGDTYAIRRLDDTIVRFFAYTKVPTDVSGENAILDEHGRANVYWNISEHSGLVGRDKQRALIVELLEALKFNWGRGVGKYGLEVPVNVRVVFDAPNPN